jgi:hypothetical protein
VDIDDLRVRAEKGSVVAQGFLGLAHLFGHEVPVNHAEAVRWLSAAAQRGAARPSVWLGTMYEQGLGVSVDTERARQLYEFGAERGEFDGCIFLARLLSTVRAGSMDEWAAAHWYRRALALGADTSAAAAEIEEATLYLASHPAAP